MGSLEKGKYTSTNLNLFGNTLDNGKVDKYTSLGTRERSESEREQRSAQGNPQSGGLRLCILVPQLPPRVSQMDTRERSESEREQRSAQGKLATP